MARTAAMFGGSFPPARAADMGRLLDALIADTGIVDSERAPAAKPANLRIYPATPGKTFADSQYSQGAQVCKMPPDTGQVRERLLTLADAELIDPDLVRRLPESDLRGCTGLPDPTLRAYLHALDDSELRQAGKVPRNETARGLCRHCGPVWLAPEIAAVAPKPNGLPFVLGCPWCHITERSLIPRPPVHCRECTHFVPDTINPAEGMGRCKADRVPSPREPMPYPNAARECERFEP